jgi:ubiquinone/menaquinone biosynthesis C-methylase UbiE
MMAENIKVPDGTFDRIYAFETLEHVGDLSLALQEIHRVIKPGGSLVFSLPIGGAFDGGFHTQKHSVDFWKDTFSKLFVIDELVIDKLIIGKVRKLS